MHDSFDIVTVIFAALAIFILFKLRSVLGTKTGYERPPEEPFRPAARSNAPSEKSVTGDNVVQLPGPNAENARAQNSPPADRWRGFASEAAWPGLEAIAKIDRNFEPKPFVDGARAAYEMIVVAFHSGDRAVLQNLLAKDVYESFNQAISARETRGEKVETTFVSLEQSNIEDAQVRGTVGQVTVRFVSKLITATRDAAGTVVDGSPDKIVDVTDIWTFSRDLSSNDPNWRLIATESH